ncbi:hypothetical protein DQW77_17690 [Roseovarius sp. TE539]|uniref:hypothetical protein n=1 Tax=Roseovarius sp. TE539 TaxID=2249812 RepID=UPI000E03198E|nr:hypothetical protein [Roseovarius sp. TE539]RBI67285.1 hypothetical protein DQW77_17690 [Roseovarius sp. TE539]
MGWQARITLVAWIGLLCVVSYLPARAQTEDIALDEREFHERFDEHGRVSGDVVMGVMIGRKTDGERDDAALADLAPRRTADVAVLRLPPRAQDAEHAKKRLFCVRINSKDGRFEAENTYSVADGVISPSGPFPYMGRHEPIVTALRAVSLVKVGQCGDRADAVIPSTWGGDDIALGSSALHVFVNSAGNPTVAVMGSGPEFIACNDIADASTLKYTASCVLPFDKLQAHAEDGVVRLELLVTRSLGEESFDVMIVLPKVTR